MKKYQILENRADFKIIAFGKTKEDIFINMILAMQDFLKTSPSNLTEQTKERNVKIKSIDLESLLVDFLNEIIFFINTEKEFYTNFKFKKLTDTKIEAVLTNFNFDSQKRHIKAAKYEDVEFLETSGKWQATVLFDI